MDKPLLAIDIDGVISLFGFEERPRGPGYSFQLVDGVPHCISLTAGDRLRRLGESFELVWASGWEDKANFYLPQMLGLPELPHVSFDGGARDGAGAGDGLGRRQPRPQLPPLGRRPRRADAARPDRAPAGARGGSRERSGSLGGITRLNQVHGFWPIFFLLVVLKIPVLGSLWLVWWASREPEPEEASEDGGGFRRRPRPKLPRGPRRGPHGGGAALPVPDCPPGGRTRVVGPAGQPAFARAGSRAGRNERRADVEAV
jgi:hypothetical protein